MSAFLIDVPYQIQRADEDLTIVLAADAADHPALAQDVVSDLLEPGIARITVDAAAVAQANSVLIGWLVRFAAAAGPGRVRVVNLNLRARALFTRMRLDQLLVLA